MGVLPEASASRAERVREARSRMPLASHAHLAPSGAPDVVAVLEEQGHARITELLPVRYGRMLSSPFAFYRGAAAVMAADLAAGSDTGLTVQLCGDAHVSNFGLFASAERRHLFDLNDFDETWPGPFEWDVKRLAASLEIAGRGNGLRRKRRRAITKAAVRSYRLSMAEFASQTALEVWYARPELQPGLPRLKEALPKSAWTAARKVVVKSRSRDSLAALGKLTTVVDGQPRFVSDPPLLVPVRDLAPELAEDLEEWLARILEQYRESLQADRRVLIDRFRVVDLARKAVGVGSVGTRAWLLLMLDESGDPLLLQAKEAVESVLAAHLPWPPLDNQGRRVVEGQRLMQASSDILLGWQRTAGVDGVERDYYIRQFRDWKGGFEIEALDEPTLDQLGQACGWTLARAHARSGDRRDIAAYLGSGERGTEGGGDGVDFDEAVADFAVAYADKNDGDHAALAVAVESGRVPARRDL
ncbi:DUF2252 domain-containing protein [Terrabacter aerolatus]|uniref:DUF2252 domain-containing protein n=1 Tax=Terrabacter aerolatus TaxID=422442 RepID=UPI001FE760B3|nr:DUF2252 domain-containing protein [Terrabacter aerolatus]